MTLMFRLRLALYTTLLLLVSFLATIEALILTILLKPVHTNYYVARSFWYIAGPIMGWKFEVEGEEHLWVQEEDGVVKRAGKEGRSAVMLGNHQSFVDILYLGRIFPKHAAIMAKKSIKWIPGLGWFMMMSGTVFINRGNNKSAVASMAQAGEDMKRKKISLWIFPEGTRHLSAEDDLLPFKKGAFYLAVQSGVPIIPVVCQNYHPLMDGKTRFKRGTLRIKVLPPIPTTGLTTADVPALMDKTRDLMIATLRELSQPRTSALDSPSPTPLLQGQPKTSYEAVSRSSPLDGAVAGENGNSSDNDSPGSVESAHSQSPLRPSTVPAGSSREIKSRKVKKSIAMISDFFLPVVGGVEGHIYSLAIELQKMGHKVIVVTHHHGERRGVRYLSGLKVYHLPIVPIASEATLPNYLLFLPYFRDIVLRERIELVHAHGSLSSLGHEAMHHAPLFGVKTVFTDHSLFGFGDAVGVLTNKLLAGALRNVDAAICVSNTGRENTVLRAQLEPEQVYVIPNALVADNYAPSPTPPSTDTINIIIMSRLVYRKGIDLLVAAAPQICDLHPQVRFIVGGDGPKMVELEQMREKYQLQDRIELLGSIPPSGVRDVLVRGHIYLNTSLTEAFGISIIEAASTGLFVVATKVGGVPEILPGDMIEFCRADEDEVTRALSKAIAVIQSGQHDPHRAHERVKGMYAWSDVAERTDAVYDAALATPHKDTFERLARLLALGPFYGPILCCIIAVQHWSLFFIQLWRPEDEIEVVRADWDPAEFDKLCEREKRERDQISETQHIDDSL